jgi:acyl-CoA reductase-like NAD-dependent aldehyde dehydrogenase
MEQTVLAEAKRQGYYLMNDEEAKRLAGLLFHPGGALNPKVVGKKATVLAEMAGFSVPRDTKILMAREHQAGTDRPYSREKLCPVLAFFVEDSEDAVLRRVIEVLTFEGGGHTFCMHCADEKIVEKFALQVPVSRFVVNAPAAQGGIGECTGLFPALTLGCGAMGGSSSSNNISPMDLLDIRHVAWGSQESQPQTPKMDDALVEKITAMILEKLK